MSATVVPALPPIPPTITELTGPILVGNLLNWGLFGILTVQAYIYYIAFPNDRPIPKILVSVVYIIEVLQTVLVTRDAFREFASGYGNLIILNEVAWLWFSVPTMTAIISSIVQVFFAWRIWILSKQLWISIIVILLSLVQCAGGIWTGVYSYQAGEFSLINSSVSQTIVWLAGTAIVDVVITGSMIFFMSRSRTGFKTTNALFTKFIRLTVETGAVCTVLAIVQLGLYTGFPGKNFHLAPAYMLSKLYSNSLLVLFNARIKIVGGRNVGEATNDVSLSVMSWNENQGGQFARPPPPSRVINVEVRREMVQDNDSGKYNSFIPAKYDRMSPSAL